MTDLLDNSLAKLGDAEADLATTVLPHYGAEPEPVQTDPRIDLAQCDDQRGEQTVTLLQMLGYLREPDSPEAHPGRWTWLAAEIDAAWAAWRNDRIALASATFPSVRIRTEAAGAPVEREDQLRRDLKACATLEGEVKLTDWPEPGKTTLASRIVLMRLRIFGLDDSLADAPMPADLAGKLLVRAQGITKKLGLSATDIINRLGNIACLTGTVRKQLQGRYVVLQTPGTAMGLSSVRKLAAEANKIHALNPAQQDAADWNRFSLRLLQVRLWTLGYYQGEVDGRWGALSQDALERFFGEFDVNEPARLCGLVQKDYVVLDIGGTLELFTDKVDKPADALEREQIDELLTEESVKDRSELLDALEEYKARQAVSATGQAGGLPTARYEGDDFTVASAENVRRKRYFGWRGVFASFGRFLRKVGGKVVNLMARLIEAVRKGLDYVRNILRYAIDATRVAVRVGSLAIRRFRCWLMGTPVVTPLAAGGPGAATFWQHDHDTINLVGTGCPPEIVDRHRRLLGWMQRSVGLMLEIGVEVLRAMLAFGNWLLFAWRLLKTIRTVIQQAQDPLFAELLADKAAT